MSVYFLLRGAGLFLLAEKGHTTRLRLTLPRTMQHGTGSPDPQILPREGIHGSNPPDFGKAQVSPWVIAISMEESVARVLRD